MNVTKEVKRDIKEKRKVIKNKVNYIVNKLITTRILIRYQIFSLENKSRLCQGSSNSSSDFTSALFMLASKLRPISFTK